MTSKEEAKLITQSASDLKAVDIIVLDLGHLTSFTDFFVICSGTSNRHVQSIADRIVTDRKKEGLKPIGVEGIEKGDWVLVDFGGVVAHIFHPDVRVVYNIEKFWGDAKKVRFKGIF